MLVPFVSGFSKERTRYRRAGGGGGGGGGSGGGGRGGSSGGSSGGSRGGSSGGSSSGGSRGGSSGGSSGGGSGSSGARTSVPIGSGSNTGGITSSTAYGSGGGSVRTIPSGAFAGRTQGGGTRDQVYGSRTYGSGYPGVNSRGVNGLGFPFYFWPVVWGGAAGAGGAAYLHSSEYGDPSNSTRPGGALMTVPFTSSSGNTTLHVMADNSTSTELLSAIASNCSSVLASNSTGSQAIVPFVDSNSSLPKPEQAVQYYRASSVVLTLDGYNDTTTLNGSAGADDAHTPIPTWVNSSMLNCLNQTIGAAVPLVDASTSTSSSSPTNFPVNHADSLQARNGSILRLVWVMVLLLNALS